MDTKSNSGPSHFQKLFLTGSFLIAPLAVVITGEVVTLPFWGLTCISHLVLTVLVVFLSRIWTREEIIKNSVVALFLLETLLLFFYVIGKEWL